MRPAASIDLLLKQELNTDELELLHKIKNMTHDKTSDVRT